MEKKLYRNPIFSPNGWEESYLFFVSYYFNKQDDDADDKLLTILRKKRVCFVRSNMTSHRESHWKLEKWKTIQGQLIILFSSEKWLDNFLFRFWHVIDLLLKEAYMSQIFFLWNCFLMPFNIRKAKNFQKRT